MADSQFKGLALKVALPVLIGVAVIVWLFSSEFSISDFERIDWSTRSLIFLGLALIMVAGREAGMMWRWKLLAGDSLTWTGAFRVTIMCEFTSAITPTSAGGSALSMVFLSREGIPLGRATSFSMITLMLDQFFLMVMLPVILFLVPAKGLFGFDPGAFDQGVKVAFWIVYAGVCLIGVGLALGALVCPQVISRWLCRLFSLRWLRRWLPKVEKMGADLAEAGAQMRKAPWSWWLRAIAATFVSWICRFLVVNALFLAFVPMADQIIVFARQLVVWTLLTVSPTPGGSGLSEWLFTNYYGDLLGGDYSITLVIALVWRLITYYIYPLAGVLAIPSWLRHKNKSDQ
ncbi:MAG: flippase-like domain-containing protein [Paramuribaculum sp.]|nr:flippase-like domain-containing protein [Paramuribaculum sp.]